MFKKAALIIVLTIGFTFVSASSFASEKLKVAASIYPLAHFAGQVAGEFAEIVIVMPPGSNPHEYEPTPRDIKKVYDSNVFLYNGAGLDSWAENLRSELMKQNTEVIEMEKHFSSIKLTDGKTGKSDPHIWLDPLMAIKEVEIIRDTFIIADPLHETQYRNNSAAYINKLNSLHDKYRQKLKPCKMRDIIVSHDAFGYLSSRYNLRTHAITGISTEEEPSPRKMVKLVKLAINKNIKYIFHEPTGRPKPAETIAGEIGAKILILNPIGGLTKEDIKKGRTYISVMENNLDNLLIALECGQ